MVAGERVKWRGFSIVEVAMASAIIGIVFAVVLGQVTLTTAANRQSVARVSVNMQLSRSLDFIASELRQVSSATLTSPMPGAQSATLFYQKVLDFDISTTPPSVKLSVPTKIGITPSAGEVLADGTDNDKDGLTDEGRLQMKGIGSAVLIDNAMSVSFLRSANGRLVNISLEVGFVDSSVVDPTTNKATVRIYQLSRDVYLMNP